MRTSVTAWGAAFFAALGLGYVPACGIQQRCVDGKPVMVDGVDTGLVRCEGPFLHRREAVPCPIVGGTVGDWEEGHLDSTPCKTDADCHENELCFCGETFAACVPANCRTDADCGDKLCSSEGELRWADPDADVIVFPLQFACQTDADECASDDDCSKYECCAYVWIDEGDDTAEHHTCQDCTVGRPFLVEGEARTASRAARADWSATSLAPHTDGLDPALRAELVEQWTRMGLMEHASVASFARFVLHLLSLGAPPELVSLAQAAMADEIAHARTCFAIASAYAGRAIGPGRLALDGALGAEDVRAIVTTAVREGCVGETIAALEAAEGAARAADPAIAAALAQIADDERRHALLAWRFVRWAIETGSDDLRAAALEAFAAEAAEETVFPSPSANRLAAHGLIVGSLRHLIHTQALTRIIEPCIDAIVRVAPTSTHCFS